MKNFINLGGTLGGNSPVGMVYVHFAPKSLRVPVIFDNGAYGGLVCDGKWDVFGKAMILTVFLG